MSEYRFTSNVVHDIYGYDYAEHCERFQRRWERLCSAFLLGTLAIVWVVLFVSMVRAADVGQIPPNVSPAVKEWFKNAHSPRSTALGYACCDIADGHIVPYEADDEGTYWVTILGQRLPVPKEAIVPPPYALLEGVVWYRLDNGVPWIRCFAPGGGA